MVSNALEFRKRLNNIIYRGSGIMKIKALLLTVALVATIFTGCGQKADKLQQSKKQRQKLKTDAVTSASVVNDEAAFQ